MVNSEDDREVAAARARAVFPVGEIDGRGELADDDLLCSPCEGEEEEAALPGCLPAVYQPTLSEYLDHCVTHYPFRAWCKHCLEGRGREFGHEAHRGDKDLRATPVVSFDYAFLGDEGDIVNQESFEAAGEGAIKILIIRDSKSKSVFAHVVPSKGVDEGGFSVRMLIEDVKWLGYSKVTLKSDNEPAIVKLLSEALRELRIQGLEQTLEEHSPEYDPQANGSAEVAVRLLKGHLRTLRSSLEAQIGFRIPVRHALMTWLVRHAAALISWCAKGHDGQTAHQRVRGREFRTRLLTFGECCSFKNRSQEPLRNVADGRRFHQGVFIGIDRRTGQYMLYSDGKVKLSRTVIRVPESDKWSKDRLAEVKATPLNMHQPVAPEVIFKETVDVEKNEFVDKAQISRQVYLKAEDFDEFGLTRGCPKCENFRRNDVWGTRPHSKLCRDRVVSELSKTVVGRTRIDAAMNRLHHNVEELVEAGQKFRTDVPQGEDEQEHGDAMEQPQPEWAPPQQNEPEFIPIDHPSDAASHRGVDMRDAGQATPFDGERGGRATDECGFDYSMVPPHVHPDASLSAGNLPPPVAPGATIGNDMDVNVLDDGPDTELKNLMGVLQREEKKELEDVNREILAVIRSLGGDRGRYKRERTKALKAIVSEIYSPPRVTAASKLLPELKLIPGFALDLTTADTDGALWDFDSKVMRERAMRKLKEEKPMLLIGSPMCTAFSTWQRINNKIRDPYIVECEKKRAVMHLEFCMELYKEQLRNGRYFVHEHPAYAASWQEDCVKKLMTEQGVEIATCDQCMYGSAADDGSPVKKPTSFMTNAPELAKRLRTRCDGKLGTCGRPERGQHAQCRGRTARMAAIYHFKLCRAILMGFRDQLRKDGTYVDGFVGLLESRAEREQLPVYKLTDVDGAIFHVQVEDEPIYRDDLTGQLLPPDLVRAARAKELEYFNSKQVWQKRPVGEARRVTGKPPISVRWVDVNKGDNQCPNIRSRLVARQIRQAGEDAIFAPTPPLEALRSVLSLATTDFAGRPEHVRDPTSERRTQVSAVDIARAYFNASTDEDKPTYVALPAEDGDHQQKCGLLKKHMYGTRAAADGWQQEYSGFLRSIGFVQGTACPCLFVDAKRGLALSVHGDDFTTIGSKCELNKFERELESKYDLKTDGRLGPGPMTHNY